MQSVNKDILRQTLLVIAARSVRDLRIGDFYEVLYSGVPNIEALSGVRHALHSLCLEGFLRSPMSGQYIITQKGKDYLAANRISIASTSVKERLRKLNGSGAAGQEDKELPTDATEQQNKDNKESARHRKYVRDVDGWASRVSDGTVNADHPILRRAIDKVLQGGMTGVESQKVLEKALKKAIAFGKVELGTSASNYDEKGNFYSKSDGEESRTYADVQERCTTGNGVIGKEPLMQGATISQVSDELYRGFNLAPYMKKAEKGELTVQDTFDDSRCLHKLR